MTENLTTEKKERNKQYILDHLDEYVLDSRGNFVNIDSELMASKNAEYYLIGREAIACYDEILEKIFLNILENKEDWEVEFPGCYLKNKNNGRVINAQGFSTATRTDFNERWDYILAGELGYRKGIWENYEEEIKEHKKAKEEYKKWKKEWDEWCQKKKNIVNGTNGIQSTPPKPKIYTPPTPPTNDDSLPPPDNQEQFNPDKEQEPEIPVPEPEKSETEELLKIIITAELLIKEKQFNPEILSKLLTEKEKNTPIYQIINQEGRVEKVIGQLESIKISQPSNNNNNNSGEEKDNNFPTGIIFGSLLLATIVGLAIAVLIKKRRSKWIKPKQKI